jgi:hypothetical protein
MDYLLISVGVLCILNIVVSIYLYKRDDLEYFQKVAQIIVVWLLPFVGAIGLWLFNRSQDDDNKPSGGSFGGGAASEGAASGAD